MQQISPAAVDSDRAAAFSALSDRAFASRARMLEQFQGVSEKPRAWVGNRTLSTHTGIEPDGTRLVFSEIKSPDDKRAVKATLCTRPRVGVPSIKIWTFYYDPAWDAFLAGSSG